MRRSLARYATTRTLIPASLCLAALGVLAATDLVAMGVAALALLAALFLVSRRAPGRLRTTALVFVAGIATVGVLTALVLPVYRTQTAPLIVNRAAERAQLQSSGSNANVPAATTAGAPGAAPNTRPFEALGFVANDYDDSQAGVDADINRLTTVAATGISLNANGDGLEVSPAADVLVRAHLAGTRAEAVVSNFDGVDFNAIRGMALLNSAENRRRFVSALTNEIGRRGWDGVVLDIESLPPQARAKYPALVREVQQAIGSRPVLVAVPAFTNDTGDDARGYDLAALAQAADAIVWMAYDQHDPTGAAGPIAGLDWVKATTAHAVSEIPPSKVLLGLAGYGYGWKSEGHADEYTFAQAQHAAADVQASSDATDSADASQWDAANAERHVRTADGHDLWFEDAQANAVRAQLAAEMGLGGVALWRVGSEDPATLDHMPLSITRVATVPAQTPRKVEQVQAAGVVALTFDDGPDKTWTPQVLSVLEREHVPATFFAVGTEAQSHPDLLRRMVADGDVVANHTYSHENLMKMSSWQAWSEIFGGAAVIEAITGHSPRLFRSPYGAGDTTYRHFGPDKLAESMGFYPVQWNDDPEDFKGGSGDAIAAKVLNSATERTIVLLHDGGGDRSATVAALPAMIDQLKARGYLFTTVDGLDGSIGSPYAPRRGLASKARGVAIIAGHRIEMALRRVIVALLVLVALLSMLRLALCAPLAALQAWRRRGRRDLRGGPGAAAAATASMRVSVLVPAHNECEVIAKTLRGLADVDWDDLEVIVIDDGSTDGTADVAESFPGVRVLRRPQGGKAGALNAGLVEATGDVVVTIDADTVIDTGFVQAVMPHFADPSVGAVAGNIKVGNRRTLLAKLQALEYLVSLNLDRRAQAAANVMAVVPGAAGAFRRRALAGVQGYSRDTLVEDADLTVALLDAGWVIPYEPTAVAWTEAPQSVRDVMRQRRRWSFGTVQVVAKHRRSLLAHHAGRVGLLGLPWMLTTQVVLPLLGPLADAYLVYLVLIGAWTTAAAVLGLALVLDMTLVAVTVLAEPGERHMLVYAPLLRLVWRPLQLAAIGRSMHRWLEGGDDGWRKVRRYNTVDVPTSTAA